MLEISGIKCTSKEDDEYKYIHFVKYTFEKLTFEHGSEQLEN